MHVDLTGAHLRDLSLQPLVDGVLHVEPHANFVLALASRELLQIVVVVGCLVRGLGVPLSQSPILVYHGKVLCALGCLEIQLRIHHALDVHQGAPQKVEGLGLVEAHLLKIMPRVLLKYESAIASQHIGFVERAHDLLYEIHISHALR